MKTITRKDYRIVHEASAGLYGDSYETLKKARIEIKEMRLGYPNSKHISKENHDYWKKVGQKAHIEEVVTIKVSRPMQVI